jgi:hypothetical protein
MAPTRAACASMSASDWRLIVCLMSIAFFAKSELYDYVRKERKNEDCTILPRCALAFGWIYASPDPRFIETDSKP